MIIKKFPTQYSESVLEGTFEYNNKPSMTEPDNALSIPEIIARFTRGQGLVVQQHQWTSGAALDDSGEVYDDVDLNDFMEVKRPVAPTDPAPDPVPDPASDPAPEA